MTPEHSSVSQLSTSDQLSLLFNAVKDYAIYLLDPGGYVATWNVGAERIKGYTAQEIIGKHFSGFYTPEDKAQQRPQQALDQATNAGRYEEVNWRVRKNGERYWAHVIMTPVEAPTGGLLGFAIVTRDLTEIRNTSLALQESNERFRILVESVADYAIYLLDIQGRVISWNRGAEKIKGYTTQEILGQNFSIFYLPEDLKENKPANQLKEAAALGHIQDEGWRVRKDGSHFWASAVITALYDAKGQLSGFAKVTRDLTERKEAELRLSEANILLRALSERLDKSREEERRYLAHQIQEEIGTSLSALKFELHRALQAAEGNGTVTANRLTEMNSTLDSIIWETRRIAMNTRPAILEDLGLLAAIEWQLQEFQRTTGIQCSLKSHTANPPLTPDQTTGLFRVAQELLANVARHANARHVEVQLEQEPHSLRFILRDDGRGITPSQIQSPASLGLLGMRERLRLMGGDFQIQAHPQQGTLVTISLPLSKVSASES